MMRWHCGTTLGKQKRPRKRKLQERPVSRMSRRQTQRVFGRAYAAAGGLWDDARPEVTVQILWERG